MMNNCPHIKIQLRLKGDELFVENNFFWQKIYGQRREKRRTKDGCQDSVSVDIRWCAHTAHITSQCQTHLSLSRHVWCGKNICHKRAIICMESPTKIIKNYVHAVFFFQYKMLWTYIYFQTDLFGFLFVIFSAAGSIQLLLLWFYKISFSVVDSGTDLTWQTVSL